MPDRITTKLSRYATLRADEVSVLENALHDRKGYSPRTDIIRQGVIAGFSLVVVSGWACRYKVLRNGSRQITSFLLPGDSAHLNAVTRAPVDDNIGAITAVEIAHVPWNEVIQIADEYAGVRAALMALQIDDEMRLRNAIVSMGQRGSLERIGYQLCELWCRAEAVNLIEHGRLDFPVTQVDLADRVGVTAIHLNRMLRKLRNDGLIEWTGHQLIVHDFNALARLSGFEQSAPSFSVVVNARERQPLAKLPPRSEIEARAI